MFTPLYYKGDVKDARQQFFKDYEKKHKVQLDQKLLNAQIYQFEFDTGVDDLVIHSLLKLMKKSYISPIYLITFDFSEGRMKIYKLAAMIHPKVYKIIQPVFRMSQFNRSDEMIIQYKEDGFYMYSTSSMDIAKMANLMKIAIHKNHIERSKKIEEEDFHLNEDFKQWEPEFQKIEDDQKIAIPTFVFGEE